MRLRITRYPSTCLLPPPPRLQSQGEGRTPNATIESHDAGDAQQQQQAQLHLQQQQRPLTDQSAEVTRNNNLSLKGNNGTSGIPRDMHWKRADPTVDPSLRYTSGIPFDPNLSRDSMNATRGSSGIPAPGSAQPSAGPPLRLVDYLRNDSSSHSHVPRPMSASRNNMS